ncbi:MAG TPA: SUMF1/EgtB/PvdO family nonheme iron enzyme, partial [Aggregatilineales bacterium]|nr:SUMF1/EgtB/PvdO family nonheme iron enzyme [Aggregatilineales bacterium]
MLDIDWVKIPEGEVLLGLSDEQRETLHKKIWASYGVDNLDPVDRAAIESLAMRHRQGAHYKLEGLTREERRVLPNPNDDRMDYFYAEGVLGHIPQQEHVWLPSFYIARYPITHAQASEFFRDSKRARLFRPGYNVPNMPEEFHVLAAIEMIDWLGARFPTTLEWEKVACGIDGRIYPWGNEWDASRCNLTSRDYRPEFSRKNGFRHTVVDAYPKGVSSYGVWDMVGNVCEWVRKPSADNSKVTDADQLTVKGESPETVHTPEFVWALPARTHGSGFNRAGDGEIGLRPV